MTIKNINKNFHHTTNHSQITKARSEFKVIRKLHQAMEDAFADMFNDNFFISLYQSNIIAA